MADEIWLDVLPSMAGFATDLVKNATKAAKDAGTQAGAGYKKAFQGGADGAADAAVKELESAQKSAAGLVQRLAGEVSTARQAQKKSAADLLLAEQRLADATQKYGEESNQAQAAALKLEAAQDKATQTSTKYERAEAALKEGQKSLTKTTEQLETQQKQLDAEVKEAPGLWGKLRGSMADTSDTAKDTGHSFEGITTAAKATAAAAVAAAAAVVSAGTGLFHVGSIMDDVQDTIRTGTGETGAALDALVDSARNIGREVPVSFDKIGIAVSDVHERLGLTGKTLETFTSQALEIGHLMKEELNLSDVTGALNIFNIKGDDTTKMLDYMFQVSQFSGLGMNDLAQRVKDAGPAVQELGFGFEDTAMLIGLFDKAGIDSQKATASMSKGLVTLARAGEEPAAAFERVVSEIGGYVKAGDTAKALDLASTVFGTRGAAQFLAAIKSGALGVDDLTASTLLSGDTILGVAKDTADFSEAWQLFRNDAMLKLEPVAKRVFGTMTDAMEWIRSTGAPALEGIVSILFQGDYKGGVLNALGATEDSKVVDYLFRIRDAGLAIADYWNGTLLPALQTMGTWVVDNKDWILALATGIGAAVVAYQAWTTAIQTWQAITKIATGVQWAFNAAMDANPVMLIVIAVAALAAGLWYFFTQTETGRQAWEVFSSAVTEGWNSYIKPALEGIGDAATWLWKNILQPYWTAAKTLWGGIATAIGWYWTNVMSPAFNAIGAVATWLWNNVLQPTWAAMSLAWGIAITAIGWWWDNVLQPTFNTIATVATWLWQEIIEPVWSGISTGFQNAATLIGWWWDNFLGPIINTVGSVIWQLWKAYAEPAWAAMQLGWGLLVDGVSWFWDNVLKPVFDAVGAAATWLWENAAKPAWDAMQTAWGVLADGFSVVWDTVLKPVFDAFKTLISETIPDAFTTAKDAIGTAWDGIKSLAATPINFVIETVYNNGLRKAINKVVNFVGGDPLPVADPIPAFATGGFHQGGWALVGEQGPELVNFGGPGYVYTAAQTTQMTSSGSNGGGGGNVFSNIGGWISGAAQAVAHGAADWATGNLASAASELLNPVRAAIKNTLPAEGFTSIPRAAALNTIDQATDWIRTSDNSDTKTAGTTTKYDNGGILSPGLTQVINQTGRPERVLTEPQWQTMEQAASASSETALTDETIDRLAEKIAEELGIVGDTVRDVKRAVNMSRVTSRMGG